MAYTKKNGENDWDYLCRKANEVYQALHRIRGFKDVRNELFDNGTFYWEGDDNVDLTNKVMIGLLQLEIEKLQHMLENIEDKYKIVKDNEVEWHIIGKEKDNIMFGNRAGDTAKVPTDLLNIIVNLKSFDGNIQSDGIFLVYVTNGQVKAKIPKSLVIQLLPRGTSKVDEGGGER
ncbi:MAG: hypothetical protein AB1779_05450 [Candidatus Thermoplasmatota archaeon]